ncbi:hypothetical protein [Rhizobium sp. L1K21]|uniref:hypothetical protein n=1 Tax=Rhizobium sp. L1K21 TaxID=2954933 RepID=UPI002093CF6E|nr:hypothetical protein [Rhizobium sp. L1K21]MCO6186357.1 hypothetical protein [Rhizobium sp. L1K21]
MFEKILSAFAILLICSGNAFAVDADPMVPVKTVVNIAEKTFDENAEKDPSAGDYLTSKVLKANFSSAFVDAFERGSKRAEENDEPFIDYDPVSGGQDSCPLKDVTYSAPVEKDGAYEITIHFKSIYCFGHEFADEVDQTRFRVVIENGKPLIDDITNVFPDTDPISVRQVMGDFLEE